MIAIKNKIKKCRTGAVSWEKKGAALRTETTPCIVSWCRAIHIYRETYRFDL